MMGAFSLVFREMWDTTVLPLRLLTLTKGSIDQGGLLPVEVAAEDAFDDPVIGGGGGADAHADVDLPLRRHVQIGDGEDLLLLVVQRVESPMRP